MPVPEIVKANGASNGLVSSTAVPFTSIALGKTTFQITTSIGRSLQTYDLRRGLALIFLTRPETPADITATCAWKDDLFAAWGQQDGGVWIFRRGKMLGALQMEGSRRESITKLIVLGSWIIGCCPNHLEVWKTSTSEHYTTITPTASRSVGGRSMTGHVSSIPTYVNKIFVGMNDGSVEIWNLSTGKLVYTILPSDSDSGAVTALEPAPVLSQIAIARADGSITIHDVRTDRVVLTLGANGRSSATNCISFRTDGLGAGEDGSQEGIMATSSLSSGDVTFWDLNQGGRIKGILRGAHNIRQSVQQGKGEVEGVNRVEFLPGQDVMITSGMDNSLKSWIFDANSLSPTPRILHSRSGHAAPVTRLSFVPSSSDDSDTTGKWLMSAGRDQSLWGWSLRRDAQSTELSQGNVQAKAKKLGLLGKGLEVDPTTTIADLKAPEIISMACSLNRDGGMGASAGSGGIWSNMSHHKGPADASVSNATGWESVVTGHRGDKCARTWFWGRKKAGRWAFETGDKTEVTNVGITACGTFAIVGSAGGSISTFNLQSGIHRQRFPTVPKKRPLGNKKIDEDMPNSQASTQHTKAVTGLVVDSLNRTLISCSLDGKVKFWDFTTGLLDLELDSSGIVSYTAMRYSPNDLIALGADDSSIRIVDTQTKKTVRELWGCLGQINDFCFSNDSRWIVATSMDSVLRVWDLPTGNLINAVQLERPVTSLAFSDTGEYLATAYADQLGINIWNNRTLFVPVPTRSLKEGEIAPLDTNHTTEDSATNLIDAAYDDQPEDDTDPTAEIANYNPPIPAGLDSQIQSLSLVPKSRWQNLLHLDTIRERNKPKEPPKAPEKAPFFLTAAKTASTPTPALPSSSEIAPPQISAAEKSRINTLNPSNTANTVTITLQTGSKTGDYDPFFEHFKTLGPSAADIELRSLSVSTELVPFVEALTARLRQRKDYELVQAWMAVFLRIHGEVVVSSVELRRALEVWREVQRGEGKRLAELVGFCGGVLGFIRSERG